MVAGAEKNGILGILPARIRKSLEEHMSVHVGSLGDVLQNAQAPIEAAWFPLSGLVSSVRRLDNESGVEVDAAGSEGFVGIELLLGGTVSPDSWTVQSPGRFARLGARAFADAVDRERALRETALAYATAVLAVRGQWVACNARHTVEQRLAKWLLLTGDRLGSDIKITQDMVATMLGVRRASVVTALSRFVDEGIVRHGYARMEILDDTRLKDYACVCYAQANALLFGAQRG
jgi:CRP-like cAMP-binding protein